MIKRVYKVHAFLVMNRNVVIKNRERPWGENLIILVIYFTYPVNHFIARSGISQFREFP